MYQRRTIEEFRNAFADVAPRALAPNRQQRARVRSAVCALVDDLKGEGLPPERIIITLRETATDVGLSRYGDRMLSDAVRWSIEHYFGASSGD